MEERIETDPTLRQPFDAAVKYVQRGAPPKLHAHVDAYKELTERLIADFGMQEDEIVLPKHGPRDTGPAGAAVPGHAEYPAALVRRADAPRR